MGCCSSVPVAAETINQDQYNIVEASTNIDNIVSDHDIIMTIKEINSNRTNAVKFANSFLGSNFENVNKRFNEGISNLIGKPKLFKYQDDKESKSYDNLNDILSKTVALFIFLNENKIVIVNRNDVDQYLDTNKYSRNMFEIVQMYHPRLNTYIPMATLYFLSDNTIRCVAVYEK